MAKRNGWHAIGAAIDGAFCALFGAVLGTLVGAVGIMLGFGDWVAIGIGIVIAAPALILGAVLASDY